MEPALLWVVILFVAVLIVFLVVAVQRSRSGLGTDSEVNETHTDGFSLNVRPESTVDCHVLLRARDSLAGDARSTGALKFQ